MPRGRQPEGQHALSDTERQARYRARRLAQQKPPVLRYRTPADRRSRAQRPQGEVEMVLALKRRQPLQLGGWHNGARPQQRDQAQRVLPVLADEVAPVARAGSE